MKGNENMNENVTLDGYFDEAREYRVNILKQMPKTRYRQKDSMK